MHMCTSMITDLVPYMYIVTCHVFSHVICLHILPSEFLISSFGVLLTQRASYLALHSSLFGPDCAINYDYIVTNSINSLLIGSRCIPNDAHTNHY